MQLSSFPSAFKCLQLRPWWTRHNVRSWRSPTRHSTAPTSRRNFEVVSWKARDFSRCFGHVRGQVEDVEYDSRDMKAIECEGWQFWKADHRQFAGHLSFQALIFQNGMWPWLYAEAEKKQWNMFFIVIFNQPTDETLRLLEPLAVASVIGPGRVSHFAARRVLQFGGRWFENSFYSWFLLVYLLILQESTLLCHVYLIFAMWLWMEVGTDKDYLASSIAYRFDLHGTAEAKVLASDNCRIFSNLCTLVKGFLQWNFVEVVQTACSSALVAISRSVWVWDQKHEIWSGRRIPMCCRCNSWRPGTAFLGHGWYLCYLGSSEFGVVLC